MTLVLRVALSQRGRLVRGDVLDAAAGPRGLRYRFVGWRGLTRALHACLEEGAPDATG